MTVKLKMDTPAFAAYKAKIDARRTQVISHEEAHKAGAGPQASGSPVYDVRKDKFGNEVYFGGHQGISVPSPVNSDMPLALIEKTKVAAKYVIKGAEAPADELSEADKRIAFSGREILNGAERAKTEKAS